MHSSGQLLPSGECACASICVVSDCLIIDIKVFRVPNHPPDIEGREPLSCPEPEEGEGEAVGHTHVVHGGRPEGGENDTFY